MPANVILVVGPSAAGKTGLLRDRARQLPAANWLWLAPTIRVADAVRAQFTHDCVVTFPDFASRVVLAEDGAASMAQESHQRLILEETIAELARRGKLSAFAAVADTPGFAMSVFSLLIELKGQGITPGAFADAASTAKHRQLADIFANYQQRLTDLVISDRDGAYVRARNLWASGRRGPFTDLQSVFVDGFLDFTPLQLAVLESVAATVGQLWITLTADSTNDQGRAELFSRPNATMARLHGFSKPTIVRLDQGDRWAPVARPGGIAHLERALFQSGDPQTSPDATGVAILEAPGALGEARMLARSVKSLLLDGVPTDAILLTARDIGPTLDLMREVFAEYGVPLELDATEPLTRDPYVRALLKAMRLADEDFPFAATTALLRNTLVRPSWPEVESDPDVMQYAEVLLRMFAESRGKEVQLRALAVWAREPPPGLEDERAEESRRRRQHELAVRCRPFLERLFGVWDDAPQTAPFARHFEWLRGFANELGLGQRASLDALWTELDGWAERELAVHGKPQKLSRSRFHSLVATLASLTGRPIPGRGVRLVPAEQARHLDCQHLFLYGLGERSFPQADTADPLASDADRAAWRDRGIELKLPGDRLADEMLLFFQLVVRPRIRLTLSYAAVDEAGLSLLPSTFLAGVRECLPSIPIESRRMLLDRFDRDAPMSAAEYRVRWAMRPTGPWEPSGLGAELEDHLRDAAAMAQARFESREYSPYDGLLRNPAIIAELAERFGPSKVFSPTSLESYVECPYRFFAQQVLKLEPLGDPVEEIESTRRGAAYHRALARLHDPCKVNAVLGPDEAIGERLSVELATAVGEYAARASGLAGKTLWRLEGERLQRSAIRYARHWATFLEPWTQRQLVLGPRHVEVDFGVEGASLDALTIEVAGVEVRLGGRIDRIDVVDLADGRQGFWVIDYKTGRGDYYTGSDLQSMRKLQLSLYTLATERVILADARPLGLAYWLVAAEGPKAVLPGRNVVGWLESAAEWPRFRTQLEAWVATLVGRIRSGEFPLSPRSDHCTEMCDFARICRIAQSRSTTKAWSLPLPTVVAHAT